MKKKPVDGKVKFDAAYDLGWQALLCPRCEDEYLHQWSVETFFREEDDEQGLHVVVADIDPEEDSEILPTPYLHVDASMESNPSARRDGIRIKFWCENCQDSYSLTIVQHKGLTLLEWEA